MKSNLKGKIAYGALQELPGDDYSRFLVHCLESESGMKVSILCQSLLGQHQLLLFLPDTGLCIVICKSTIRQLVQNILT